MKKLNYLLMGLFVASAFTFTSCTEDGEDPATVDLVYSINSGEEIELTSSIIEADFGSKIDFVASFIMGSNKIESVKIKMEYDETPYTLLDSTLNEGLFNGGDKTFDYDYSVAVGSLPKKFTFTAIDTKGVEGSYVVTISPKSGTIPTGKTVRKSTAKLMGAQANANGSLYSVYLDEVVKLAQGTNMSSSIDMVYYYGSTNKATIGAPSATDVQSVYSGIKTWSIKNATLFVKLDNAIFTNITDEASFNAAYIEPSTDNQMIQLTPGEVFAVKTANGDKAIVRVASISALSTSGAISIDIKALK